MENKNHIPMDISYNHIDIISHALCLANVILKNNYEEIKGKGWNEIDDAYESYIAEVGDAQSALQHIRKKKKTSLQTVNAAIYRKELRDKIIVTKGAMILDGYEPEDSCIKFINELIDEL